MIEEELLRRMDELCVVINEMAATLKRVTPNCGRLKTLDVTPALVEAEAIRRFGVCGGGNWGACGDGLRRELLDESRAYLEAVRDVAAGRRVPAITIEMVDRAARAMWTAVYGPKPPTQIVDAYRAWARGVLEAVVVPCGDIYDA